VPALVASLAIIAAAYLLVNLALLSGLGLKGLAESKAAGAEVMERTFGPVGGTARGLFVAIAALTSINATMIVGARNNFALGQDWPLLSFMSKWHGVRNVPVIALLVQSGIALLLVAVAAVEKGGVATMVEFTAPVFWGFLVLVGIGFFVLRFRYAQVARPFKVPGYPILPIAFIATCGYLFYSSLAYAQSRNALHWAAYLMIAGLIAWLFARFAKRG
jgi:basic amino acid/polyamine antiporter, APA family